MFWCPRPLRLVEVPRYDEIIFVYYQSTHAVLDIWKSMCHLVLKKRCIYLLYIGRVRWNSVFPREKWLPTEMKAEHRLTPTIYD